MLRKKTMAGGPGLLRKMPTRYQDKSEGSSEDSSEDSDEDSEDADESSTQLFSSVIWF